jgi:lysophospholipase
LGYTGGTWVTGSLYANDFPTVNDVVYGDDRNLTGWLLDIPLATPDGSNLLSTLNQEWFGSILWSVIAKGITGMYVNLLIDRYADSLKLSPEIRASLTFGRA